MADCSENWEAKLGEDVACGEGWEMADDWGDDKVVLPLRVSLHRWHCVLGLGCPKTRHHLLLTGHHKQNLWLLSVSISSPLQWYQGEAAYSSQILTSWFKGSADTRQGLPLEQLSFRATWYDFFLGKTPFILAADVAPISRFFLTPSSGQSLMVRKPCWPQGEKMGSLEAGAKLINIKNGQALTVLLDVGAGHRGAVGYQGCSGWWHRRHFWKRGSSAWLHAPSPSAPEAWFWAPWQEASKWKGKTKKCIFFFFVISKYIRLRDMNEKHLSCGLSSPLQEEGRKRKTKLLKQT